MSDLSRSDDYYRKVCFVGENLLPAQEEIRVRLKNGLAEALFDSCLPALKPMLGLIPPLQGPGVDLWVSPSDLLIPKVRLKPPLTSKHVKALTHEGILQIGGGIEKQVQHEFEIEKKRALLESEIMLKLIAEKHEREAIAKAKEEMEQKHEITVDLLKEEFREDLKNQLEKLRERLLQEKEEAVEQGKLKKEEEMQSKLETVVHETMHKMIDLFATQLYNQSLKLHTHFWFHIKQERRKLKEAVEKEKDDTLKQLELLRCELQCENIANVMYMLANERRRCACEKLAQEQNFIARIEQLEKDLEDKQEKLATAISDREAAGDVIKCREAVLFSIIQQFQKFIYFALKAIPTQAEYLLNIEKLMIYELSKITFEKKTTLRKEIIKEKSDDTSDTSNVTVYTGSFHSLFKKNQEMIADHQDHHNCENYARFVRSAESLEDAEDLTHFVFNDKIYVREDFRNMISQSIHISKSHELWNFEVDDLMKMAHIEHSDSQKDDIMCEKEVESFIKEKRVASKEDNTYSGDLPDEQNANRKSFMSVRFSRVLPQIILTNVEETILQSHAYSEQQVEDEEDNGSTMSLDMDDINKHPSRLVMAKDSVELAAMKLTSKTKLKSIDKTSLGREDVGRASITKKEKATDSLIITRRRSIESKLSETKNLVKNKDLKLETAVDSFELIKTKDDSNTENLIEKYLGKKKNTVNVGIQCNSAHKSVVITHIEMIPPNGGKRMSTVSFHEQPNIIPTASEQEINTENLLKSSKTSATRSSEEKSITELFFKAAKPAAPKTYDFQPKPVAHVVGDKNATEYLQTQDEFTAKRVSSFIRIFRESPSLRQLFTEATKN